MSKEDPDLEEILEVYDKANDERDGKTPNPHVKKKPGRKKGQAGIPFTTEEWLKIKTMHESGDYTVKQIAEIVGRSESVIAQRLKKYKVKKGSRKAEIEQHVQAALEKDMNKNIGLKVRRANETKEEHYDWARRMSHLTLKAIATAIQGGTPLAAIKNDILTIKAAMEVFEKAQNQRNISLGLDKQDIIDEEDLPDFGVFQMTAAERDEIVRQKDADLKASITEGLDLPEDMAISASNGADTEDEIVANMRRFRTMLEDEEEPERIPGNDGY